MVSISSHVRGWGGERQSQSRFHNLLSLFFMKGVIQNRFTSEERASGYLFTTEDQILSGHVAVAHRGRTLVWGGYMENQVGNYSLGRIYGKLGGK